MRVSGGAANASTQRPPAGTQAKRGVDRGRGQAVRILVASPDCGVRQHVRHAVDSRAGTWVLCAELADAESALEKIDLLGPEVVVLDDDARTNVTPPHSFADFVRQGKRRSHVLLLGDAESESLIAEALNAGVKGIVARSDGQELIDSALDAVTRGKPFFSAEATEIVLNRFLSMQGASRATKRRGAGRQLTRRERQVVHLLAEGRSTREVAETLEISVKTAENHRANAMNKLGARQVSELVRRAVRDGAIPGV